VQTFLHASEKRQQLCYNDIHQNRISIAQLFEAATFDHHILRSCNVRRDRFSYNQLPQAKALLGEFAKEIRFIASRRLVGRDKTDH
jgi:hypothetical protein